MDKNLDTLLVKARYLEQKAKQKDTELYLPLTVVAAGVVLLSYALHSLLGEYAMNYIMVAPLILVALHKLTEGINHVQKK